MDSWCTCKLIGCCQRLGSVQVEEAGERVVAALREAYEPIADAGDLPYNASKVHHDTLNNAVCIKVVSSSKVRHCTRPRAQHCGA